MEAKSLRKKPFTYTRKNVRRESLHKSIFTRLRYHILFAHGKKERIPKSFLFGYYQKKITMTFTKE
jgi:hypothetical protein